MTIHEVFRRQASLTPDATALVHGHRRIDYRTLDAASDAVALRLDAAGVRAHQHIPILFPRSAELVAAILGVLKLGASYAALDPAWPQARISVLAGCLASPMVVASEQLAPPDIRAVRLETEGIERWATERGRPPSSTVTEMDPATIFFTSGSSGQPKAVVSPHAATVRLLAHCEFADMNEHTIVPLAAPVPWDAFSLELWGPLLGGGTAVVISEPYLDTQTLRQVIRHDGANTVWLGASLFNLVVDEDLSAFDGVDQLIIGGERVSSDHARRFLERFPSIRLINGYGPVECTVFATTHSITIADCFDDAGIPIGRAVSDTEIFVLYGNRLCDIGETGEICLSSPRLALGYLSDDVATGDRFLNLSLAGTSRRMYRTGDLGHWARSGLLYYDGRKDRQVKIRGHRIEPGEIEHAILKIDSVAQCAIEPVHSSGGTCTGLVAYLTMIDGTSLNQREIYSRLSELPDYLIPQQLVQVENLPLLSSGKLDRQAIAQEASKASGHRRGPNLDPVDKPGKTILNVVHDTVAEVLSLPDIPMHTSIFDLGATSLDAGRVCARLSQRLGLPVPVSQVMRQPTVGDLASWIDSSDQTGPEPRKTIGPASLTHVPLLPIQVGFLLANQIASDEASHCPFGWWVEGPLDEVALAQAAQDVHLRHEALRARYLLADPPLANLEGACPLSITQLPTTVNESQALQLAQERLMCSLDLTKGEVWRLVSVRNQVSARTLIGVVVHHIAWDGTAECIVVDELSTAYRARISGEVPQFSGEAPSLARMHLEYQRQKSQAPLDRQRDYWRSELADVPALSFDAPPEQETGAGSLDVWISSELVTKCDYLAAAARTTRFAALLNGYAEGIARVTGQTDFGIGVPVTKRSNLWLENGVNCLIDLVCIRARPNLAATSAVGTEAMGQILRSSFGSQDIPFDEVVRLVNPPRSDRPPLYQTMFTLEPKDDPGLRLRDCDVDFIRFDPPTAMTELGCALWPQNDGGYRAHFIYRPDRVSRRITQDVAQAMLTSLNRYGNDENRIRSHGSDSRVITVKGEG